MLIGGVKLFQCKLSKFVEEIVNIQEDESVTIEEDEPVIIQEDESDKNCVDSDDDDDELPDESAYENWKGFGKNLKHKKFDWIRPDTFNDDKNSNVIILNDSGPVNQVTKNEISNSIDNREIKVNEFEKSNFQDCSVKNISLNNSIDEDHCYSVNSSLTNIHKMKVETLVAGIARQIKNEGKYFQTCSEINLINDGVVKKINEIDKNNTKQRKKKRVIKKRNKKISRNLLENGISSGPITFKGISWFAYNTCPFDSIIQLLYNGALEDQDFLRFLTNSKNKTFSFVVDFLAKGITLETYGAIYQNRFEILYPFYKNREIARTDSNNGDNNCQVLSRVIDCQDNVNSLWDKLFRDEPSVFEEYLCLSSTCKPYQKNLSILNVDYEILLNGGFQSLEKSITFMSVSQHLFCKKCKSENLFCTRTLNAYVYIELEIPGSFNGEPKKTRLRELPKHINLSEQNVQGEIKQLRYRLCGVIGYENSHYIAYCQSLSGNWQFYNDLLASPNQITSSTLISPHGVLYIICRSSSQV
ncbi:uncharacterized protein LOC141537116 [Cotesia typhae]|uniref:uncharacterized protein LOC141537116 n=1 Tax=Cotesia typhae TaxID=2053667 RepID=UPI003D6866D2